MTASRSQDVRRASIRVALAATGAVAAVYVAIAVAVLLIVTSNLTAKTDADLAGILGHIADEASRPGGPGGPDGGGGFELPSERGPLDPNTVIWTVRANGSVTSNNSLLELPVAYRRVTGPTTTSLAGTNVRLDRDPDGAVLGGVLAGVVQQHPKQAIQPLGRCVDHLAGSRFHVQTLVPSIRDGPEAIDRLRGQDAHVDGLRDGPALADVEAR